MRYGLAVVLLAAAPIAAADNALERAAKSTGKALERTGNAIERGGKRTAKAAERPRAATQRGLERAGKKIDNATGGR
jgi:hypothetical protein